ncbi:hypothetical protein ACSS6W_000575 [Trichoderma asperelloides]
MPQIHQLEDKLLSGRRIYNNFGSYVRYHKCLVVVMTPVSEESQLMFEFRQ